VLDEADEMLDLGFKEDLEYLLGNAPVERRTLLFSATLPREIERWRPPSSATPRGSIRGRAGRAGALGHSLRGAPGAAAGSPGGGRERAAGHR
jgi:hypothetical protein